MEYLSLKLSDRADTNLNDEAWRLWTVQQRIIQAWEETVSPQEMRESMLEDLSMISNGYDGEDEIDEEFLAELCVDVPYSSNVVEEMVLEREKTHSAALTSLEKMNEFIQTYNRWISGLEQVLESLDAEGSLADVQGREAAWDEMSEAKMQVALDLFEAGESERAGKILSSIAQSVGDELEDMEDLPSASTWDELQKLVLLHEDQILIDQLERERAELSEKLFDLEQSQIVWESAFNEEDSPKKIAS
jgi:hypothetical protein